jgi:lipoprotein-anchoring transpeptidase ErfK/SrfK
LRGKRFVVPLISTNKRSPLRRFWPVLLLAGTLAIAIGWHLEQSGARRGRTPRKEAGSAATSSARTVAAVEFKITPPPAEPISTAGQAPEPAPPAEGAPKSASSPTPEPPPAPATEPPPDTYPRPVASVLEAQVALARRAISSGSIDGIAGAQTAAALRAFQEKEGFEPTGRLDDATRAALVLAAPPLTQITVTEDDLAVLRSLSPTWLGKSQQTALAYETVLELLAERTHANPKLLRQLNPDVDWSNVAPGTVVIAPAVGPVTLQAKAAALHVRLAEHVLEARADDGALLAHFPVSIAASVEKRPVGELRVKVVIPDPDYTFDPAVFPESEEARALGRKLMIPPGPNNPVGVAWIGLDRPGYGIHGTPNPEHVGRTESHGCLRLANWDARLLLDLAWVGLPVFVDP